MFRPLLVATYICCVRRFLYLLTDTRATGCINQLRCIRYISTSLFKQIHTVILRILGTVCSASFSVRIRYSKYLSTFMPHVYSDGILSLSLPGICQVSPISYLTLSRSSFDQSMWYLPVKYTSINTPFS
jgi:hypothetical protein